MSEAPVVDVAGAKPNLGLELLLELRRISNGFVDEGNHYADAVTMLVYAKLLARAKAILPDHEFRELMDLCQQIHLKIRS